MLTDYSCVETAITPVFCFELRGKVQNYLIGFSFKDTAGAYLPLAEISHMGYLTAA